MNSRFILTQGSETVKPDLTVPSGSSDIRLVAETSENRPVKRRGFRKRAKNSTANSGARPARRIKLNRSIFNTESTAKPTIHVQTLNDIKTAIKGGKDPEVSVINNINCVVQNTSIASAASPMPATAVDLTERSINSSPVNRVHASPSSDTRTVIKRENSRPLLLLPSIELRRISQDEYKRLFTNQNKSLSRSCINGDIRQTLPKKDALTMAEPRTMFTQPSQGTPAKKRKINPNCLSNLNTLKKHKVSPIRSPDSEALTADPALSSPSPLQPPSPLDTPPSPALSLGAHSDDDFDNEAKTAIANSRVIRSKPTNTETTSCKIQNMHLGKKHCKTPTESQHMKPVQTTPQCDVHSRLGPPQNTQTPLTLQNSATSNSFVDDALDVMSVIADDDELFLEDEPKGPLKRSVSQDSIFSTAEETNNHGNPRSLAKKPQANQKHTVGDLITNKPMSKSFRIPRQNSEQNSNTIRKNNNSFPKRTTGEGSVKHQVENHTSHSVQKGSDPPGNNFFRGSHRPPKPTRVVSKERQPLNGFSVQEKLRSVHRNLGAKNIQEAWLVLKELEDSRTVFDVRILEDALRVCESVSVNGPTPLVAEIAVGVFKILKRRQAMKPMSYILTVLTLCRCGMFQEAFQKLSDMIDARLFPPQDILVHFFNDLLKCLRTNQKWIFELLPYIKRFNFSNPTYIFNNCLSPLVSAPANMLREISPSQWDTLISMLSVPPNVQGSMQVQNIMNKHCIPMSDQSVTKLLNLYRDTKCTKQLLDLFHLKCANEMFDIGTIFDDQSLNLRNVEAHMRDLVKNGSLPRKEVLHHFIEKATVMKEFSLVYNLFLQCKSSSVSLSVTTLKKMVDMLENWDENMTASVEVYAALRQAKMSVMKEPRYTPPLNQPQKREAFKFQDNRCFSFMKTGWCNYGDRCWFSHVVEERPQFIRQSSDTSSPQSVGECRKSDGSEGKQLNAKTQASTSANTTMVNGHSTQQFPSFQHPSFVVPMFNPIRNHVPPLRVPQPVVHPQAMPTRPPFPIRFQPRNVTPTPRFAASQPRLNRPKPLMFPRATTPDKIKLNRSFSWEPTNDSKPLLRQSPLPRFQQPNPSSDNNNNKLKVSSEVQQRVDQAVTSKDWPEVYLSFVECKQANNRTVDASDLRVFRNVFLKDCSFVGSNFSEFVDFIHKEKSSVKSSNSGSGNNSLFDQYDIEFLGSLAVSLMEKCLVTKRFDKGYEILHTLHAHNISYFDCGKNFGAYTRDIPPSAVAIIAVKLCTGVSQDDGLLGAVEVLRASNYAVPEDDITPDNMEYRVKVLQQVFTQLFDQGNISEAYEILQHLNASPNIMVPLYVKVLNYYSSIEDFDQSFDVLAEMNENGFDLNIPACQSLYEKFLKLCITNGQDNEACTALEEMESRGIMLNGDVWKEILNQGLPITNDILINMLFQRCLNLHVYPATFSRDMPWLCQLGCGYSQVEVKLLIVQHLKQLRQYLVPNAHSNLSLSTLKDFQIALFPRVSGSNVNQKFSEGIQTAINKNSIIVTKVLQEDLNPPLIISDHTQEQFHSKFIVDSLSLYRWFNANQDGNHGTAEGGDDVSSNGSLESCVSYMTRMTEFD